MSAFSLRLSSSCFALLASHLKNEMIVIMGFIFNVLIWQNIKLAILCWSTLPQIIFEIFLAYEKPESGSCWDGCYISTSWGGVMRKSLVGPRTRHPQIWHLGTVNGSGWRDLRNNSCRKDSGLPVKQVVDPHVTTVLLISGGKGDTVSIKTEGHGEESQWTGLTTLSSYPFVLSHFPPTLHSPSNVAEKCSSLYPCAT